MTTAFSSFLQEAIDAWAIDPRRVHFGGSSAGGLMTWRMICRHSDVIASFAPISAATVGGRCFGPGRDNPPTRMLHLHGQLDTVVPFAAATSTRDAIVAAMGREHQARVLFEHDGALRTRHSGDGLQYDLFEYPDGHCLPGGHAIFSCRNDLGFEAGQAILDFYVANPKP